MPDEILQPLAEEPEEPEYDVFLSHNRYDKRWVRDLYGLLLEADVKVFFDEVDIKAGDDIVSAIDSAISSSRHVVLILSKRSVASKWVGLERSGALMISSDSRARPIIPILIDSCKVPPSIARLKYIDARGATARDAVAPLLDAIQHTTRVISPRRVPLISRILALFGVRASANIQFGCAFVVCLLLGVFPPSLFLIYERAAWLAARESDAHVASRRVAGLLSELGDINLERGELAAAAFHYQRAVEALDMRAKAEPNDGEAVLDLSEALYRLGRAQLLLGDPVVARSEFENSLAILEGHFGPENDRVTEVLIALGDAKLALGLIGEALDDYQRSLEIHNQLLSREVTDGYLISKAGIILKIAAAFFEAGDFQEALGWYESSLDALSSVQLGGANEDAAVLVRAAGLRGRGWSRLMLSDGTLEAIRDFDASISVLRPLVDSGRSYYTAAYELAKGLRIAGSIRLEFGEFDEVAALVNESAALLEGLRRSRPQDVLISLDLSRSLLLRGDLYRATEGMGQSLEDYERSVDVLESMRGGSNSSEAVLEVLAKSYERLGTVRASLGDLGASADSLRRSVELLASLAVADEDQRRARLQSLIQLAIVLETAASSAGMREVTLALLTEARGCYRQALELLEPPQEDDELEQAALVREELRRLEDAITELGGD